jgi:hypothetical protein
VNISEENKNQWRILEQRDFELVGNRILNISVNECSSFKNGGDFVTI